MSIYLETNFAPVSGEVTALDLPVIGAIPKELEGRLLRNGPNPMAVLTRLNTTGSWATEWCTACGSERKGRVVPQPVCRLRRRRRALRRPISGPNWAGNPRAGTPTSAGRWHHVGDGRGRRNAGRVDLRSRNGGPERLLRNAPGRVHRSSENRPMHTGEMHAVAYAARKVARPCAIHRGGHRWPGPQDRRCPDGNVDGARHVAHAEVRGGYDLPVTVDLNEAFAGKRFPFRWTPEYGARVGRLPREGTAADIVWVDVPISDEMGTPSTCRPARRICRDRPCVYDKMFDQDRNGPFGDCLARLERWEVNPAVAQDQRDGHRRHRPGVPATRPSGRHEGASLRVLLRSAHRPRRVLYAHPEPP